MIASVASERHGVFEMIVTSSYSIYCYYWCCCSIKSINYYSSCSKFWSDLSNLAWILVSKNYSEDKDSEVRVTILFSMCYDEKLFGYICFSPLNSINSSYLFSKLGLDGEISSWNFFSKWSSEDGCSDVVVSPLFWMASDEYFLNTLCHFSLNSWIFINVSTHFSNGVNYSSCCSKLWLDGEILLWGFLSKWSSEYGCSELMVSTSFLMSTDEKFPNSSWCSSFKSINYSSCFSKNWSDGEILACNFLSKWSVEDGCSEVRVSNSFWMGPDENIMNS